MWSFGQSLRRREWQTARSIGNGHAAAEESGGGESLRTGRKGTGSGTNSRTASY